MAEQARGYWYQDQPHKITTKQLIQGWVRFAPQVGYGLQEVMQTEVVQGHPKPATIPVSAWEISQIESDHSSVTTFHITSSSQLLYCGEVVQTNTPLIKGWHAHLFGKISDKLVVCPQLFGVH